MTGVSHSWPDFLVVAAKKILLVSKQHQYTLYEHDALLYGMTWDDQHIYVSTRHEPEEGKCSHILRFDKHMVFRDKLNVVGLGRDVHQLLVCENILYICNTDRSSIVKINLDTGKRGEIRWTAKDVHLNSIWRYGNMFYVVEHRHEHSPKGILLFDADWRMVAELSVETGVQERVTGFGLHDIFVVGGTYVTLGPYSVYKIKDGATIEQMLNGVRPGHDYLRGFAALPGRFLIGASGLGPRSGRGQGDSRVLLTDERFRVLDTITTKDTGQLCSVRLLKNDLAHHQRPCPYRPSWR